MDCKEVSANLNPFISGTLSASKTRALLKHLKECDFCCDELNVRLMAARVNEILKTDKNVSYDLRNAAVPVIRAAKRKVVLNDLIWTVLILLLLAGILFVILHFVAGIL